MKLLITGATGLVGSEIVKLSLEKGHTVNYLTTRKNKINSSENLQGFYWEPARKAIDMKCFEGVDAIINLAGANIVKRWTPSYKEEIIQSRTASLDLLNDTLNKVNNNTVTAMATASGIGIYPSSFTTYYEENEAEIDNSFLGNVVVQWENAADKLKTHTISLAKIRTGLVLAGKGGALPPMVKSINYYVGAPFGNGEHWQSWIHIKDIARLFLFAVENRLDGIYNGVAPNAVTNAKLIKEIASVLKKPVFLPAVPKGVLKLLFGEMASLLYCSQRVSAKKIEEKGFIFNFKTISMALKDLL